jgi:hypothetical protein
MTYETVGGFPANDPKYDRDDMAACRELLMVYERDQVDPEDLECDPENDKGNCPIRNFCPMYYQNKVNAETRKRGKMEAKVSLSGALTDWSLSLASLLSNMKEQAADRGSANELLELWREYGRLCVEHGSENIQLYITGDLLIEVQIEKGEKCEVCGTPLEKGLFPERAKQEMEERKNRNR